MQLLLRFDVIRIKRNAIDRTYFAALWLVEVSDALGAFGVIDFVDLNAQ